MDLRVRGRGKQICYVLSCKVCAEHGEATGWGGREAPSYPGGWCCPLLTLNASAVSLLQLWVQNQLPIKATKSLRSALELPLPAFHSSVSFQLLCGTPLPEGKEGLWSPLWGRPGITCVPCHLNHFSTLVASRHDQSALWKGESVNLPPRHRTYRARL